MPPWDATDHTAGVFLNERTLTQEEIDTVVAWAKRGAPKGDPSKGPAPREWEDTGGFLIGKPDLLVYMEEPYHVGDDVEDEQPNFFITLTEEMLPEPRWIQAIEYQPDAEFVHHITGRALIPDEDGEVDVLSENTFSLGSIAAGEDPTIYPPGFGNLLRAGMVVRLNVHYHKEPGPGSGGYDRSAVAFRFHPVGAEVKHKVTWNTIGAGAFEIPPGHGNWRVGSSRIFEKDTVLLSLHPHMHFRGQSMKYTAHYPDGAAEVLLDVPEYDYSWQTNYIYREPKVLPAGTRVEIEAVYDNSETKLDEYPFLNIGRAGRLGCPEHRRDDGPVPGLDLRRAGRRGGHPRSRRRRIHRRRRVAGWVRGSSDPLPPQAAGVAGGRGFKGRSRSIGEWSGGVTAERALPVAARRPGSRSPRRAASR